MESFLYPLLLPPSVVYLERGRTPPVSWECWLLLLLLYLCLRLYRCYCSCCRSTVHDCPSRALLSQRQGNLECLPSFPSFSIPFTIGDPGNRRREREVQFGLINLHSEPGRRKDVFISSVDGESSVSKERAEKAEKREFGFPALEVFLLEASSGMAHVVFLSLHPKDEMWQCTNVCAFLCQRKGFLVVVSLSTTTCLWNPCLQNLAATHTWWSTCVCRV